MHKHPHGVLSKPHVTPSGSFSPALPLQVFEVSGQYHQQHSSELVKSVLATPASPPPLPCAGLDPTMPPSHVFSMQCIPYWQVSDNPLSSSQSPSPIEHFSFEPLSH